MMRRWLLGLLSVLLLVPLPVSAQMYSIAELHRQAEEMGRWTQVYEAHGRTIEVDVPIEVPDVEKLPVLRLSREWGYVDEAYHSEEEGRAIGLSGIFAMPGISSYGAPGMERWEDRTYSAHLNLDRTLAGDIGKTAGDLLEELEATVKTYWGVDARFQPEYVSEKTRYRAFDEATGTWKDAEDIEPYAEASDQYPQGEVWHGLDAYTVSAFECLHGVPLLTGMLNVLYGGSEDWEKERFALVTPVVYMCTPNGGLEVHFHHAIETGIACEDVPVCGFEDAKAQFEKLIESGNLRGVNAVRLGYVLCLDSEDGDRWAVPMWVLDGKYVHDAGRKDKPEYDDYGLILDYARASVAVMQSGELVDMGNQDEDRLVAPEIVTWEGSE